MCVGGLGWVQCLAHRESDFLHRECLQGIFMHSECLWGVLDPLSSWQSASPDSRNFPHLDDVIGVRSQAPFQCCQASLDSAVMVQHEQHNTCGPKDFSSVVQ